MIRDTNTAVRDFYVHVGYGVQPRLTMARWLDSGENDPSVKQIEVVITYSADDRAPDPPDHPDAGRKAGADAGRGTVGRLLPLSLQYCRRTVVLVCPAPARTTTRCARRFTDPKVEIYVLYVNGEPAGYVELDRRPEPDIDFAYFGIFPQFVGRGFGPVSHELGGRSGLAIRTRSA